MSGRRRGAAGAALGRRELALAVAVALALAWLVGYPLLLAGAAAIDGPGGALGPLGDLFVRPDLLAVLANSLWISLASVVLAAAIGVPLAFFFARTDFPGRRLLGVLVALPVSLPPLVGVIAFLYLWGESGLAAHAVRALLALDASPWRLAGPGAILLVHAYSFYVYFYLFTRAGLARLDRSLDEAAAALGASPRRTLWRVTLPALAPALSGAALLTFLTALGSFSAPYLFGGSFRVMTTQIFAAKQNGDLDLAEAETALLAALALAGLWLARRLDRRRAVVATQHGAPPMPRRLASKAARWGAAAAGWALALLLLAPHLTLGLLSLVPAGTWTIEALPPVLSLANYAEIAAHPERLRPLFNSFWMAAVATAVALALGLLAARVSLRQGGRLGALVEALIAVPWAIPGTAFAFALATAMSVDRPWAGRFVLVGTAWLLPLAYLARSLPMTGRAALAGLRQLDPSLGEAAAALGATPARTLRRVSLPLLRPALAAGASLAFLAALGDFVVSIVLYTYETRPISIEILSSLRLAETGVGAAYGVLLAAASAAAFLLFNRKEAGV